MVLLRLVLLLGCIAHGAGFASPSVTHRVCRSDLRGPTQPRMMNLFGGSGDKKQRDGLSLRSAQAGDRVVTFRKANSATVGLQLGLKFRESFGKAVYIDKIVPGTEAARLKAAGKIREGDEITMVSATFGDELWSARNIGKYRLEKSISVRQGMSISFVMENSSDQDKKNKKAAAAAAQKKAEKMNRLQDQLTKEVNAEKEKPKFLGLF